MLQVHACVSVECDQCGDNLEAHYPRGETAALDAAAVRGWLVGPGGRWWCSACGPVLVCEHQGHEFTGWHDLAGCTNQAPVSGGETGEAGLRGGYRYCRRCCLHESRPSADGVGELWVADQRDRTRWGVADERAAG